MPNTGVADPASVFVLWTSRAAVAEMPNACFIELCSKCVASPETYAEVFTVSESVVDRSGALKLLKLHTPVTKVDHITEAAACCTLRPDIFQVVKELGQLVDGAATSTQLLKQEGLHDPQQQVSALGRMVDVIMVEAAGQGQELRSRALGCLAAALADSPSDSGTHADTPLSAVEHVEQLAAAHRGPLTLLVYGPSLQCVLCVRHSLVRWPPVIQEGLKGQFEGPTSMKPQLALLTCSLVEVRRGDMVLDPCCGSGALLDVVHHFGAVVAFASDVNQPNSILGDIMVINIFQPCWRSGIQMDAIVCDLPYGCREVIHNSKHQIAEQEDSDSTPLDADFRAILEAFLLLCQATLAPGCRAAVWLPHDSSQNRQLPTTTASDSCWHVEEGQNAGWLVEQWLSSTPEWLWDAVQVHQLSILGYLPESRQSGFRRALLILVKPGHPKRPVDNGLRERQQLRKEPLDLPEAVATASVDDIRLHRTQKYGLSRNLLQADKADIWRAAWLADLPLISAYLEYGGDPNALDTHHHSQTPLHCAAGYGREAAVQLLLQGGADPDIQGGKRKRTPLHCAIAFNHLHPARALIQGGASLLLSDVKGRNPLHEAAQRGHVDSLNLLLGAWDAGCSTGGKGPQDDKESKARAEPNNEVDFINVGDLEGLTALHEAARYGRVEVVQVLLARPELRMNACGGSEGFTAAHLAARWGHADVLQLLHEAGAAMDIRAAVSGTLPLDEARVWSRPDCIALLAKWTGKGP